MFMINWDNITINFNNSKLRFYDVGSDVQQAPSLFGVYGARSGNRYSNAYVVATGRVSNLFYAYPVSSYYSNHYMSNMIFDLRGMKIYSRLVYTYYSRLFLNNVVFVMDDNAYQTGTYSYGWGGVYGDYRTYTASSGEGREALAILHEMPETFPQLY